jgi:hypothetical protein
MPNTADNKGTRVTGRGVLHSDTVHILVDKWDRHWSVCTETVSMGNIQTYRSEYHNSRQPSEALWELWQPVTLNFVQH